MTASNTYGKQVVIPVTNKSGGALALGDVVIVDTTNNDAVTTTTAAASTQIVGVVQEAIASNATGRVLFGGITSLVNVNASVTRGHYGATHTVAKQAADAGANRGVGTFVEFTTGGTTPEGIVFNTDLLGSSLTNPMTNVGDIIYGSTAGAPARLADVAVGSVLISGGVNTAPAWGSVLASTSFAGYNTVGGSFLNMNGAYAKKITLAATSLILSIGVHVKGNATNLSGFAVGVMTSGGTVPANLIARGGGASYEPTSAEMTGIAVMNTTARWIDFPVNAYLAATDYWIYVVGGNGGGGLQLAYDGSGSDATVGNFYPMDHSVANWTAGTNKHSIRALILT